MGTKDYGFYGYVLLNARYGGTFVDIFNNEKIINPINTVLGESCVLYSYTSSSMAPGRGNDSSHIHVDSPIFLEDFILRMGVIIPLVDFTKENGATTYLPKSHKSAEQPSEDFYESNCKTLEINAGDAWFFHTRLWHSGGKNNTFHWRHALTMNVSRPWIKQRVDIPGVMRDFDQSLLSEVAKQKLGFYAQVPRSYDEYWAPPEKRTFRQSNI
jgi:ectoine hydroxylase-related dioxygenase (phytanoyl-CoA dioxygenase family)